MRMNMDTDLKTKWVEALRSGRYSQATEVLHDEENGGFCCLGVLCKVMGAEFGKATEYDEDVHNEYDYVPHIDGRVLSAGDDQELRPSVLSEVGLTLDDQIKLVIMNDGTERAGEPPTQRHSFAEIADYIEKNL
jgi:hypothetical protein